MADRGTDWGSVVAGFLFVGLAVAFVLRGTGDWSFSVWWVLPVLVGGLFLAVVVRRLSRHTTPAETGEDTGPKSGTAPED